METGGDLFPTRVNPVVLFEPLVRRIGCNDKEMLDGYLLSRETAVIYFKTVMNKVM